LSFEFSISSRHRLLELSFGVSVSFRHRLLEPLFEVCIVYCYRLLELSFGISVLAVNCISPLLAVAGETLCHHLVCRIVVIFCTLVMTALVDK
ncbi:3342_t:CDS:1, partial [Racocetra persica]